MLDLWSVDDLTARGHLVAAGARVLDHDDRTVTVASPAERVGDVADAGSLRQRTYEARSPSTPRPTTTR